jgi:hypothetical protein
MTDRNRLLPVAELTQEQSEQALQRVSQAILKVLNSNIHQVSYVNTSLDVYKLVISSNAMSLYEAVRLTYDNYADELGNIAELVALNPAVNSKTLVGSRASLGEDPDVTGQSLLDIVASLWSDYSAKFRSANLLLTFLEKTYISLKKLSPLNHLATDAFRLKLLERTSVQARLTQALLRQVSELLEGNLVDKSVIRLVLSALVSVNWYCTSFEPAYFADLKEHYERKAAEAANTLSWTDFINTAEADLMLVNQTCDDLFPLSKATSACVVAQAYLQIKPVHNEDCTVIDKLLIEERHLELSKLFRLYSCIPVSGLKVVSEAFCRAVTTLTAKVYAKLLDDQKPVDLVQALIDARSKFHFVVQFANTTEEINCLKVDKAMRLALANAEALPFFLANYLDTLLRTSRKQHSSLSEMKVMSAVDFLSLLPSIDLFLLNCKLFLAERLLHGSVDQDLELLAINEIKLRTSVAMSRPLFFMYRDYCSAKAEEFKCLETDVTLRSLTTAMWPAKGERLECLPAKLSEVFDGIKLWYTAHNDRRRLNVMMLRGTVVLSGTYAVSKYDLSLTTFQAVLLLHLEEITRTSIGELLSVFHIDFKTLMAHLAGLLKVGLISKTLLLTKSSEVWLNPEFKSSLSRVKVPLKVVRKDYQAPEVSAEVERTRRDMIEAASIRVMKARRELKSNELYFEVIKSLETRFEADISMIRNPIERLIERGFLAYKANEDLYSYLA